jgi:hypothetical protein
MHSLKIAFLTCTTLPQISLFISILQGSLSYFSNASIAFRLDMHVLEKAIIIMCTNIACEILYIWVILPLGIPEFYFCGIQDFDYIRPYNYEEALKYIYLLHAFKNISHKDVGQNL